MTTTHIGLFIILAMVLTLPFSVKKIEEELEFFLFAMGCFAVTITAQWNIHLIEEALVEPIKIALAVLFAGLLFRYLQKPIADHIQKTAETIGLRFFVFLAVAGLGFISSVITAIIASLVLVEIISCLKMERKVEVRLVILACFSIGFGAALTPIGEPLSTIAIAKLKGKPYHADFFFLARLLGVYIVPGILLSGFIAMMVTPPHEEHKRGLRETKPEDIKMILIRTAKIYLFVMALIFLGSGFKPIVDTFIMKMPYQGLYWVGLISAVVDNATLAAAEIGPSLEIHQIKAILLGLLIAGGMLIPGNIPNIISAGKLKIRSSEWAVFALPVGFVAMIVCFFVLN